MSEQSSTSSSPDPGEKSTGKDPRRWGRRGRWAVIILLALTVIFRISLMFLFPWVVNRVAASYGLKAEFERMDLSLLGGDVGIWHLQLAPTEGGEAIVRAGYTRCNISPLDLLRGRLRIYRLEGESVDVLVERKPDGSIPLLRRFMSAAPVSISAPNSVAVGSSTAIDLTSPLRVEAFRLTDVHAHIRDEAVAPEVDADVEVNLLLTDLDSTVRPTHLDADLSAPPILDLMHIDGTGTAQGQAVDATVSIQVRGLHPRPAAGYLSALGLRPMANYIAMRANATLKTSAAPTRPGAVMGTLTISDMAVTADGEEAAALDHLTLDAEAVDTTTALLTQVAIDGVRCQARRTPQGAMRVAGLDFIGGVAPSARPAPSSSVPLAPLHWGLGGFSLRNFSATLHDQAVTPATDLIFQVSSATAADIFPEQPSSIVPIDVRCAAPGIARTIRLRGTAEPFAAAISGRLKLAIDGIRPDVLAPYLAAVGLESTYLDGSFGCDFDLKQDEKTGAYGAHLSDAVLRNGGDLFAVKSADVLGVSNDGTGWRVDSIEIHGPALEAFRDESGAYQFLGLKTTQAATAPAIPATRPSPSSGAVATALPALHIGRLSWTDIVPRLEDRKVTPHTSLAFQDAGLVITNLNIDPAAARPSGNPAHIHAWAKAPNLIGSLVADGDLDPAGQTMSLTVDGKGITAKEISPYFSESAIEPDVQDGAIHLQTNITYSRTTGVKLAVKDLAFIDGGRELVGVDAIDVDGLKLVNGRMTAGSVDIQSPRLTAERRADLSLQFAGIHVRPPAPASDEGKFAPLSETSPTVMPESEAAAPRSIDAALGEVHVANADLRWTDRAVVPAAEAHLTVNADVKPLEMDHRATIDLSVTEEHALDQLKLTGTVIPSLTHPSAKLTISATGLRSGAVGSYLPAGVESQLKSGLFHADFDADADLAAGSGHLAITDLDYRDGQNAPPMLKFDSFRATASKVDLAGRQINLDEIQLDGLEGMAGRSPDGSLDALGFSVSAATKVVKVLATTQPATRPWRDIHAVGLQNLARLVTRKYPHITLQALDLNVRRFSLFDQGDLAAPLVLTDMQLKNRAPVDLLGDDPASRPPIDLELTGAVNPLAKSVTVDARLSPFADQPAATVDLKASGISGAGVIALAPSLANQIDGSQLTDGRFKMHVDAVMKLSRSDPLDFDLSKGFGLDATIKGIRFTEGDKGPVLAGIGEITSNGIRVLPKQAGVLVKDVEVTDLSANGYRDGAGIHALGIVLKMPASTTAPAPTQPAPATVATAALATRPATPIRIDQVLVSGLNFNFVDRTCDPPLTVPLNQLDVEVHDLSNMLAYEDKSCRFSLIVNAAQNGAQAPLFSQAEASGLVSLYPKPSGWVKSSVSALDLTQLRGPAAKEGVTLGGGTFDGAVDLYLNGEVINSISRLSVTDLTIAEPANGPIQRGFQLNVRLDVAIGVLQDPSGAITLVLPIPIRSGHISMGDVKGAFVGAVGGVIATAIASAPVKVVGAFLPLGGGPSQEDNRPIVIQFGPGDTSLASSDLQRLLPLVGRLRGDRSLVITLRHDLSAADRARAAILANPLPDDCLNLAYRLHQEKLALLTRRAEAAQEAKAELASGFGGDADAALARVRNIDQSLAATEDALDQIYDLLRPGAARQADTRTRAASLRIGQDRLDAVNAAILADALRAKTRGAGIADQIKIAHASFNAVKGSTDGKVTIEFSYQKQQ